MAYKKTTATYNLSKISKRIGYTSSLKLIALFSGFCYNRDYNKFCGGSMDYANPDILVRPKWLDANKENDDLVIVDCPWEHTPIQGRIYRAQYAGRGMLI
ncbi:MAG: hypothetical protein KAJ31_09510 [Deltaproteobacteria bacterium]|nr:hypothetical protein [Deltaproteobacteria bacterium]